MTPRVVIHYCGACHYEQRAREIAAALEHELGLTCQVQSAWWGTFRIELDAEVVYDRWRAPGWLGRIGLARAPHPPEIVARVRDLLSARSHGSGGHVSVCPAVRTD